MPLYPIEKASEATEGDHYAEIQTVVNICFTEEVEIEAIDELERQINCQVAMLVSFMLGQAKERSGIEGTMGVCDIFTRALAPGEAIAEYYRQMADDAETEDDDDPEIDEATLEQVREAMEAWSKKPSTGATPIANEGYATECESYVAKHEPKPYTYPCGLRVGDVLYFGDIRSMSIPLKAAVAFPEPWYQPSLEHVSYQGANGPMQVHTSHIRSAERNGVELQRTVDGRIIRFSEPKPAGS